MTKARAPASPSSDPCATEPIDGVRNGCPEPRVIVIDAGHGGDKDLDGSSHNNATAASGTLEKSLTLDFAKSLKEQMSHTDVKALLSGKKYNLKVFLTREEDTNLTSSARVKVATDNKADILVSIHFNGGVPAARGTETYYKDASNGSQSNEADDIALATSVNTALYDAIKAIDSGAKNRGIKPDTDSKPKSIGVLRDPGIGHSGKMCRSILIEVEFITNTSADETLVSGDNAAKNRDAVMLAVAKALAKAL